MASRLLTRSLSFRRKFHNHLFRRSGSHHFCPFPTAPPPDPRTRNPALSSVQQEYRGLSPRLIRSERKRREYRDYKMASADFARLSIFG